MHLAFALPSAFTFQRNVAAAPVAARPVPHAIAKKAFHHEGAPLGLAVQCLTGCLWLTQDGDDRDIVLDAGQSHTCDRQSRLVVHALDASTFTTCRQ